MRLEQVFEALGEPDPKAVVRELIESGVLGRTESPPRDRALVGQILAEMCMFRRRSTGGWMGDATPWRPWRES